MNRISTLLICLSMLFLYACQDDQYTNGQQSGSGVKARFNLHLPDYTQVGTRATSESAITDVTILQFKNGTLEKKIEIADKYWGAAVETDQLIDMPASRLDETGKLIAGGEDVMVLLANFKDQFVDYLDDINNGTSYTDFLKLTALLPDAQTLADLQYMPMTGFYYGGITKNITNQINVSLTRSLAKINFALNTTNFKVEGKAATVYVNTIELRNVPLEVTLFESDRPSLPTGTQPGSWAGTPKLYPTYDAGTFTDLKLEHNQSTTPLTGFIAFMPENVRGSFTGITSNKDKRPDVSAVPAGNKEGWPYIYVKLDYINTDHVSGIAEYCIYLGGDDKGDINILSGVQYNVTTNLYGVGGSDTRINVQATFDPRPEEGANDGVEILGMANSYIINDVNLKSGSKPLVLPLIQARRGWLAIQSEIKADPTMASYTTLLSDFDALIQSGDWEIVTLWKTDQTGPNVIGSKINGIKTVDNDEGKDYFAKLELSSGTLTHGHNYVIGLRNKTVFGSYAANTIWWSWHLWVTDYKPDATNSNDINGQVHTYKSVAFDPSGLYGGKVMMDRNLGATGLATDLSSNAISIPTDATTAAKWYGLMYQWGRKDPFTPANGTATGTAAMTTAIPIYGADGVRLTGSNNDIDGFPKVDSQDTNKLVEAVRTPRVYFYNSSNATGSYPWTYPHVNDSWGGVSNVKSAFDPCPPGWRISKGGNAAENNVWSGFNGRGWNDAMNISNGTPAGTVVNATNPSVFQMYVNGDNGTADNATKGRYYDDTTTQAWYPASGNRNATSGVFYYVGAHGYSWAASVNGNGGCSLNFYSTGVYPQNSSSRANGFPVRCVSE